MSDEAASYLGEGLWLFVVPLDIELTSWTDHPNMVQSYIQQLCSSLNLTKA